MGSDNNIVETSSGWEAVSDSPSEPYNRQLRGNLMTGFASRSTVSDGPRSWRPPAGNASSFWPAVTVLREIER